VAERRRFAGGADWADAVRACRDLELDLLAEGVEVDIAPFERGDERDGQARKSFSLGLHQTVASEQWIEHFSKVA
jgi:hypothetical protein